MSLVTPASGWVLKLVPILMLACGFLPAGFFAHAALPQSEAITDVQTETEAAASMPARVWGDIQNQPDSPRRLLTKTRLFMVQYLHERNALMLDSIEAELMRNWEPKHPPLLLYPYERLLLDLLLSRYQRPLDSSWMIPGWEGQMLGKVPPEEDAFGDSLAGIFHAQYPLIVSAVKQAELSESDRDWLLTWIDIHQLRSQSAYGDTVGRRLFEFAQNHPRHRMSKYFHTETPAIANYSPFAAGFDILLGYGFPGGELSRVFGRGFSAIMAAHLLYGPVFLRGELAPSGSNVLETYDARQNGKGRWREGSSTTLSFASLAAGYEWAPLAHWGAQAMAGITYAQLKQDTMPKAVVKKNPKESSGSSLNSAYRPMFGANILYRFSDFSKPKRPAEWLQFNAAWNLGIRYYPSPWGKHGHGFDGDYWSLHFGFAIWRRGLR